MKESAAGAGGVGFFGLLTILFIGLKLTGYIDWSWFWVLAPIWISILIGAVFFVGFFIFVLVMALRTNKEVHRKIR